MRLQENSSPSFPVQIAALNTDASTANSVASSRELVLPPEIYWRGRWLRLGQ